ncbi:sugar ABC transporter ATP-binding protein [Vagococcus lutrae]|uniref:sugar ABC transporter ATP-binding protein n=1 Tax=Vagococcus lutrae TaxID=81947 RepID=UPI002010C242|nr:sugar ABC transporter ATP-binding protein [Vagococcus lutrae]MDT2802048.1 sugar ABC transporter ATP-binding protein [Vagococcus lutrae]MDT2823812.1 sugar ABC transporter ATP-binding protein [Vagococcus lutrae]MDT2826238.1 sugar ABC transporter ATP-binding protein [Vagococcus lutrae]MDT2842451.1 sugar ABC transporter ATP-binding protein [Vagococcus lutrae]UQF18000.1 sugar ABC transporter ATP-binding protein [Vagococcus lutrae]
MKITITGIKKAFGANRVLEGVDFELLPGEIHALMGENGAGKSTLMNILTGLHKRDAGTIVIDGQETYYDSTKEAELAGVSFIHQEINAIGEMSVIDNLFLNREKRTKLGLLDYRAMEKEAQAVFEQLNIKIDLYQEMGELSVGQQQMIEIAKSLMTNAQVIIMDEPTAALTNREIRVLFDVMHKLKAQGVSIVYISHRMEEIFEMCDRITVMRDGISVSTRQIAETQMEQVVREMVGREIGDFYPEKTSEIGEVRFEVENLALDGVFEDISFNVRSGEILGFSGLMGAGRTEIMRTIFGLLPKSRGTIRLEGKELTIKSPEEAIRQGIGFLTEDRKDEGLILDFSIRDNVLLPSVGEFSKAGLLNDKLIDDFVELLVERLTVKTASVEDPASSLSGGNQQKVVLAKWLGIGPKVLILDEPTRGVDVGAKREIYLLINELAERGVAIIMISSDLPEVLSISDRIMVVREGRLMGEVAKAEATQERVMQLATGGIINE